MLPVGVGVLLVWKKVLWRSPEKYQKRRDRSKLLHFKGLKAQLPSASRGARHTNCGSGRHVPGLVLQLSPTLAVERRVESLEYDKGSPEGFLKNIPSGDEPIRPSPHRIVDSSMAPGVLVRSPESPSAATSPRCPASTGSP